MIWLYLAYVKPDTAIARIACDHQQQDHTTTAYKRKPATMRRRQVTRAIDDWWAQVAFAPSPRYLFFFFLNQKFITRVLVRSPRKAVQTKVTTLHLQLPANTPFGVACLEGVRCPNVALSSGKEPHLRRSKGKKNNTRHAQASEVPQVMTAAAKLKQRRIGVNSP